MKPCALFIANRSFALVNSRLNLMSSLRNAGWHIVAASSPDKFSSALIDEGFDFVPIEIARSGLSFTRDCKTFKQILKTYKTYRPVLAHHFNAKPVLFGSLAAKLLGQTAVFNTVTGLGHAFIRGGFTKYLAAIGYRYLLKSCKKTIFQNRDDHQLFLDKNFISENQTKLIIGAGVDTKRFRPVARAKNEKTNVLFVGRLIWQKGIKEYVDAAKILRPRFPEVNFLLAGEWDDTHPDAVGRQYIRDAHDSGIIEFLGYIKKPENILKVTDLVVLPSYREGLPRVLIEAAAAGVPAVASDVPGCRDAVLHQETGLLVPVKDAESIANGVAEFLSNPRKRQDFGSAARKLALHKFDKQIILQQHLTLYRECGVNIGEHF